MAELASRTSLGGQVDDTNNGAYIREVYADGVYAWSPLEAEEIDERLSDLESNSTSGDLDGRVNGTDFLTFYRLARDN